MARPGPLPPRAFPQKRYFRQRAHINPLADHTFGECVVAQPGRAYMRTAGAASTDRAPGLRRGGSPVCPGAMDWTRLYPCLGRPDAPPVRDVEFADVGCGYGGLLGTRLRLGRAARARHASARSLGRPTLPAGPS